jgi:hypothetical protein
MDKLAMIKKAEVTGILSALIDSNIIKIADERVFGAVVDTITENLSENYDMDEVLQKTAGVLEAAEELLAAKENLEAAIIEESVGEEAMELPEEDLEEEALEGEGEEGDIDLSDLSEEELAALEELSKEAEQYDGDMIKAAMIRHHELILKKEAGVIDEAGFVKEANLIGTGVRAAGGYLKSLRGRLAAPFQRGSDLRKTRVAYKNMTANPGEFKDYAINNIRNQYRANVGDTARAYGVAGAAGTAGLVGLNKLRGGGDQPADPQALYQ